MITKEQALQAIKSQVFKLDNTITPYSAYGSRIIAQAAISALIEVGVKFKDSKDEKPK